MAQIEISRAVLEIVDHATGCLMLFAYVCIAEAGNVQKEDAVVFMRKLCDLRGILAGLNESCSGKPCDVNPMMFEYSCGKL